VTSATLNISRSPPRSSAHEPPPEELVAAVLVEGDLEPGLRLDETVGRQQLPEGGKRLEDRDSSAQAFVLLAGGENDLSRRGEDAAALEAVVERVLDGGGDVAEPAAPSGIDEKRRSSLRMRITLDPRRRTLCRTGAGGSD
jgi:hypothetical protein